MSSWTIEKFDLPLGFGERHTPGISFWNCLRILLSPWRVRWETREGRTFAVYRTRNKVFILGERLR
jgi:hypothetical protein